MPSRCSTATPGGRATRPLPRASQGAPFDNLQVALTRGRIGRVGRFGLLVPRQPDAPAPLLHNRPRDPIARRAIRYAHCRPHRDRPGALQGLRALRRGLPAGAHSASRPPEPAGLPTRRVRSGRRESAKATLYRLRELRDRLPGSGDSGLRESRRRPAVGRRNTGWERTNLTANRGLSDADVVPAGARRRVKELSRGCANEADSPT